jgi:hypothetical protein
VSLLGVVREHVRIRFEARRVLKGVRVAVDRLTKREEELVDRVDLFSVEAAFLTSVV